MFFEDILYVQCRQNKVYHRVLQTSLNPPTFIEVTVPSQESGWSFISVIEVSMLPLSMILIFDLGIVPTVWYFLFFILLYNT